MSKEITVFKGHPYELTTNRNYEVIDGWGNHESIIRNRPTLQNATLTFTSGCFQAEIKVAANINGGNSGGVISELHKLISEQKAIVIKIGLADEGEGDG